MVLTGSFAISLVIGLSCHHRWYDASAPSQLGISVEMPGPRDFAVRFMHARLSCQSVHRIPWPNVRDDRETPLGRAGTERLMPLIWVRCVGIYFCARDWTGFADLPVGSVAAPSQNRHKATLSGQTLRPLWFDVL
jgi:hypothetical protein